MQAKLPFATKPKLMKKRSSKTLETKRAVVMTNQERKIATLIQRVNTVRNEKAAIEKQTSQRKREELRQKRKNIEEMDQLKQAERKKQYFRSEGQKAAREEKKNSKGRK